MEYRRVVRVAAGDPAQLVLSLLVVAFLQIDQPQLGASLEVVAIGGGDGGEYLAGGAQLALALVDDAQRVVRLDRVGGEGEGFCK